MVASDDSEKAYLEAYAVARQADAFDGLVGKLNSAASNFDCGRWKRFDLFKAALDILKGQGLEASDVVLADAAADLSDWPTADEFWEAVAAWRANARQKTAVDFVINGLEKGTLKPIIDRVFAFDEIVDAHRYLKAGEQIGKVVVTI